MESNRAAVGGAVYATAGSPTSAVGPYLWVVSSEAASGGGLALYGSYLHMRKVRGATACNAPVWLGQ
jgi:hypothetical protein